MRTFEYLHRSGIGITRDRTVRDAAMIMEQSGAGSLAVIEGTELVGIVTDRDIVRRAIGRGMTLEARVDGIMSSPVITVPFDADVHEAFDLIKEHGVRRLPVVREGRFVGMITVDDLLVELASDLDDLASTVGGALLHARRKTEPLHV